MLYFSYISIHLFSFYLIGILKIKIVLIRIHKKAEHNHAREVDSKEAETWEERMKDRPKRLVDSERQERDQDRKEKEKERKKIEEIPLVDFIRQTVEMMVVMHSEKFSNPPPQSLASARLAPRNLEAVRYDSGRHIIFKSKLNGVCKACKNRTVYRCERCEVAIHPDCFYGFHSRDIDSD